MKTITEWNYHCSIRTVTTDKENEMTNSHLCTSMRSHQSKDRGGANLARLLEVGCDHVHRFVVECGACGGGCPKAHVIGPRYPINLLEDQDNAKVGNGVHLALA